MGPNPGKDYGKMFDEKEMKKLTESFSKKVETITKPKAEIPPQDWPRFQIGEKLQWKGHFWRVIEIRRNGQVAIAPAGLI